VPALDNTLTLHVNLPLIDRLPNQTLSDQHTHTARTHHPNAHTIQVYVSNVRSIRNKSDVLDFYSQGLYANAIFAFTETWLSDEIASNTLFDASTYKIFRCDRTYSVGGGVLLAIPSLLSAKLLDSHSDTDFESITCEILGECTKLHLCIVYRSPTYVASLYTLTKYLQYLNDNLSNVIICGDFNLPSIDWANLTCKPHCTPIEKEFLDFYVLSGLHQLVTVPTRNENILDVVFTMEKHLISELKITEPFSFSDHSSVLFNIPLRALKQNSRFVRDFKNADYTQINNQLLSLHWHAFFETCKNIEEYATVLYEVIDAVTLKNVPLRKLSHKGELWPQSLFELHLEKRRAYSKY
jgi:hypothetical protein